MINELNDYALLSNIFPDLHCLGRVLKPCSVLNFKYQTEVELRYYFVHAQMSSLCNKNLVLLRACTHSDHLVSFSLWKSLNLSVVLRNKKIIFLVRTLN